MNSKNTICFVEHIASFLGDFWLEVTLDLNTSKIQEERTWDDDQANGGKYEYKTFSLRINIKEIPVSPEYDWEMMKI